MTKKEEDVTTSMFLGQDVLGSAPSIEEVMVTLELSGQEEQWTTATPTYSSRDEYIISTIHRKKRKLRRPTPYTCPHKISIPLDTKWDKKRHPNNKSQKVILNKKYARLPKVRCGFLQGMESRQKMLRLSSDQDE